MDLLDQICHLRVLLQDMVKVRQCRSYQTVADMICSPTTLSMARVLCRVGIHLKLRLHQMIAFRLRDLRLTIDELI